MGHKYEAHPINKAATWSGKISIFLTPSFPLLHLYLLFFFIIFVFIKQKRTLSKIAHLLRKNGNLCCHSLDIMWNTVKCCSDKPYDVMVRQTMWSAVQTDHVKCPSDKPCEVLIRQTMWSATQTDYVKCCSDRPCEVLLRQTMWSALHFGHVKFCSDKPSEMLLWQTM